MRFGKIKVIFVHNNHELYFYNMVDFENGEVFLDTFSGSSITPYCDVDGKRIHISFCDRYGRFIQLFAITYMKYNHINVVVSEYKP